MSVVYFFNPSSFVIFDVRSIPGGVGGPRQGWAATQRPRPRREEAAGVATPPAALRGVTGGGASLAGSTSRVWPGSCSPGG